MLTTYVSTYTVMFPLDNSVENWHATSGRQPSVSDLRTYFHLEIALLTQFRVVIYLIKLAFLFFYRSIFGISQLFMRAWWVVTIFTLLAFLINFTAVFWTCEAPQHLFVLGKKVHWSEKSWSSLVAERCLSQQAKQVNTKIVSMWCGLNVASDVSSKCLSRLPDCSSELIV